MTVTIDDKLAQALKSKLGEQDMAKVIHMALNGWANELGLLAPVISGSPVIRAERVSEEVAKAAADEFALAARNAGL